MLRTPISLVTTLLLCSASAVVSAQSLTFTGGTTIPFTPSQREFGQAYLKAITGSDIERYKVLLHPATRACMKDKASAEYFSPILARRVKQDSAAPKMYMMALAPDFPMFDAMAKQGFDYPVRPTHALNIDLNPGGQKSTTVLAFAASEGGHWYEVLPCPTAKALENMKQAKAKSEADDARARDLAANLRDPLRSEIMSLIKQGRSVSATNRYSEAMNVDLTMAHRVVGVLEKGAR